MNSPLISVLMPVFNAGKFFEPALKSILNQSYSNWELLIADDGCTDGCLDALNTINEPRIKVISDGQNLGISKRLNQLIDIAQGEYFARMDSDDLAHRNRLSEQLKVFLENPKLDLLATRAETINVHDKVVGELPFNLSHTQICAKPWLGFYMAHPTWMGKASWFKQFKYSEKTHFCEDQELLLRSHRHSQFATLNKTLLSYRVYPSIRLYKLLITRFSMFRFQANYYVKKGEISSLIMVCLVFIMRVLKSISLKLKNLIIT